MPTHAPEEEFRLQTRGLYIPTGDIGMWQGALRHPDDPVRAAIAEAIDAREPLWVELLYTDQVGGQRTITRFSLISAADSWLASVTRHWYLDRGYAIGKPPRGGRRHGVRWRTPTAQRLRTAPPQGPTNQNRDGAPSRDRS